MGIMDDEMDIDMAQSKEDKESGMRAKASKTWRILRLSAKSKLAAFDKIDDGKNLKMLFETQPAEGTPQAGEGTPQAADGTGRAPTTEDDPAGEEQHAGEERHAEQEQHVGQEQHAGGTEQPSTEPTTESATVSTTDGQAT